MYGHWACVCVCEVLTLQSFSMDMSKKIWRKGSGFEPVIWHGSNKRIMYELVTDKWSHKPGYHHSPGVYIPHVFCSWGVGKNLDI